MPGQATEQDSYRWRNSAVLPPKQLITRYIQQAKRPPSYLTIQFIKNTYKAVYLLKVPDYYCYHLIANPEYRYPSCR
ncbi:hypothetical protein PSEUDO9AZ_10869 [Pseudomonas sp. 9AZ]|nr:hypothetical protein PSEUDO9AZ_10869 [Pseudomonas sp. 9AZ]